MNSIPKTRFKTKRQIRKKIEQIQRFMDWHWNEKVMKQQSSQIYEEIIHKLYAYVTALTWVENKLEPNNIDDYLLDQTLTDHEKKDWGKEWEETLAEMKAKFKEFKNGWDWSK